MDDEKKDQEAVKTEEVGAEEKAEQEEYDKAWAEEGGEKDDPADPDADKGLPDPSGTEKPEEGAAPEPAKADPPASKEFGTVESMEKAVRDTKAHSTKLSMENAELYKKLKAFEEGKATQQEVDEAKRSFDDAKGTFDEARKKVYEDYPELQAVFDPLVEANRNLVKKVEELETRGVQDAEAEKRRLIRDNYNNNVKPKVLEVHGDFESIITTKTEDGGTVLNQDFFDWANVQSPALKVAAIESSDPQDIIWAVDEYKKFKAGGGTEELKSRQKAERTKKLTDSKSLRGGGATIPTAARGKKDPEDYDAGWDEAGKTLEKEGVA